MTMTPKPLVPVTSLRTLPGTLLGKARHLASAVAAVLAISGWVFSGTLLLSAPAWAEGDAEAGADKAYTCMGCHGVKHYVNTYPTYHVPRIAGQHEAYLIAALKAYRDGLRKHETMKANAGLLTDQDIADIAAFFANQK